MTGGVLLPSRSADLDGDSFSFVDHGAVPGQLVCAKPNDSDEHQAEQGVEPEQGDHRKTDNACQGKGE